jgi:hypothetical protein
MAFSIFLRTIMTSPIATGLGKLHRSLVQSANEASHLGKMVRDPFTGQLMCVP